MKRGRDRAAYDRALAYQILDEGLVCHVGFVAPEGEPVVLPTAYVRIDDELILHGARANRMLRTMASGAEVCVTVTLLDGIVLARSAFHTSMNYRSVVILGPATVLDEPDQQRQAMDRLVDHVVPGQAGYTRTPTPEELRKTLVLTVPIDEASIKVRSGGPGEEEADLAGPLWGGHIPLQLVPGTPVPDKDAQVARTPTPPHIAAYTGPTTPALSDSPS